MIINTFLVLAAALVLVAAGKDADFDDDDYACEDHSALKEIKEAGNKDRKFDIKCAYKETVFPNDWTDTTTVSSKWLRGERFHYQCPETSAITGFREKNPDDSATQRQFKVRCTQVFIFDVDCKPWTRWSRKMFSKAPEKHYYRAIKSAFKPTNGERYFSYMMCKYGEGFSR